MKTSVIVATVLLLIGCDPFYGVERITRPIEQIPTSECMLAAIESVPEVTSATYERQSADSYVAHGYHYKHNEYQSTLYFIVRADSNTQLFHEIGSVGLLPTQAEVDVLYPIMLQVEEAIEAECSMSGLKEKTKQMCSGVKCNGP